MGQRCPPSQGLLAPPAQHPGTSTLPPDMQRYPQPPQTLSDIYGNTFALCWRFLGSDLDHPSFLSNMFCQIPSAISFIHSSSLTGGHPTLPVTTINSRRFSALSSAFPMSPGPPGPSPGVAPAQQVSVDPSRVQQLLVHTVTAILFPRKTSFSL